MFLTPSLSFLLMAVMQSTSMQALSSFLLSFILVTDTVFPATNGSRHSGSEMDTVPGMAFSKSCVSSVEPQRPVFDSKIRFTSEVGEDYKEKCMINTCFSGNVEKMYHLQVVLHHLCKVLDRNLNKLLAVIELVDVEKGSTIDVVMHVDVAAVHKDGRVLVHREEGYRRVLQHNVGMAVVFVSENIGKLYSSDIGIKRCKTTSSFAKIICVCATPCTNGGSIDSLRQCISCLGGRKIIF